MSESIERQFRRAKKDHEAGHFKAAETGLRALIQTAPQDVRAHALLGLALYEQRCNAQAERAMMQAVTMAPGRADYHHNLGVVLAVRGKVQQAEGHMREALRLRPDYAEVFYNLSALIKLRHADPLTDQIEALLARPSQPAGDKIFLNFAAGKLFDDLKQYDRAFAHYDAGNIAKGVRYTATTREAEMQQTQRIFTKSFVAQRNACAIPTQPRAVFIVGMPRSGTSLTEQILSSHSQVFGAGELPDIKSIAGTLGQYAEGATYPDSAAKVPMEVLHGLGRHYLKRLTKMAGDAPIVVNKMPLDFQHLGLICSLFKDPIILHCRRDPMDTCVSNYFQNFKPSYDFCFSQGGLGHFYRMYHSLMVHWAQVLPVPIIDVCYEDLVADPKAESRRILHEMGLEWQQACATPHLNRRAVKTASWWQVRQPVYTSAQKRWKRYAEHLEPLRIALQGRA